MGGVGYFLGSKNTTSQDEKQVVLAKEKAMPWNQGHGDQGIFKYKYHPRGDPSLATKDAPSALHHTVVYLNVSDQIREKFDKQNKEYE